MTPLRHGITPVGNGSLSRNTVALSYLPSPLVSSRYLIAAARLALAVDAERVIAHLDDPQLAVGTPGEGDRGLHQRLGGDQFDLETGTQLPTAQGGLRRLRRGLDVGKQIVEGTAIDEILQQRGVFVLHPQLP